MNYEYSIFNFLTRKKLNLKEKPLIVKEESFLTYQKDIKASEIENKIFSLIEKVNKYKGEFVFLWHNSAFNKHTKAIYKKIIKKVN